MDEIRPLRPYKAALGAETALKSNGCSGKKRLSESVKMAGLGEHAQNINWSGVPYLLSTKKINTPRHGDVIKVITVLLLTICLMACTSIEIRSDRGNATIERSMGFASIHVSPHAGVVVAKIFTFGFMSSPLGLSVGLNKQTIVTSDHGCRVVAWIEDGQDYEVIYEKLSSISSICIVGDMAERSQ